MNKLTCWQQTCKHVTMKVITTQKFIYFTQNNFPYALYIHSFTLSRSDNIKRKTNGKKGMRRNLCKLNKMENFFFISLFTPKGGRKVHNTVSVSFYFLLVFCNPPIMTGFLKINNLCQYIVHSALHCSSEN